MHPASSIDSVKCYLFTKFTPQHAWSLECNTFFFGFESTVINSNDKKEFGAKSNYLLLVLVAFAFDLESSLLQVAYIFLMALQIKFALKFFKSLLIYLNPPRVMLLVSQLDFLIHNSSGFGGSSKRANATAK